MIMTLNEWYYHGSTCGYQTKLLFINTDEISSINEVFDPYHNMNGSQIVMKNGTKFNVKEDAVTIAKLTQQVAERREG